MSLLQCSRRFLITLTFAILVLGLIATTPRLAQAGETTTVAIVSSRVYGQLERGNPASDQDYSQWIVQVTQGLIQKATVRDNDTLEVVLAPQVRPKQVQPLIRSLARSFERSLPGRDLKVLIYSPNQQLALTARVDDGTVKLTVH